ALGRRRIPLEPLTALLPYCLIGLSLNGVLSARGDAGLQPLQDLRGDAAFGHESLVGLERADGGDGLRAHLPIYGAGTVAARDDRLLDLLDERLRMRRAHLPIARRALGLGRAEHQLLEQGLARLAREPQALIVLEGHDGRPGGLAHDAVGL